MVHDIIAQETVLFIITATETSNHTLTEYVQDQGTEGIFRRRGKVLTGD
jgi:hypothetical protein